MPGGAIVYRACNSRRRFRAVAAQRANPLPAGLSFSGERSPADNRQKQKALSSDRALRSI
ncbi:hypothetical protein OC65_24775 [Salmonella enterica]|nr:hypothetical protein [Salmonella enterica]